MVGQWWVFNIETLSEASVTGFDIFLVNLRRDILSLVCKESEHFYPLETTWLIGCKIDSSASPNFRMLIIWISCVFFSPGELSIVLTSIIFIFPSNTGYSSKVEIPLNSWLVFVDFYNSGPNFKIYDRSILYLGLTFNSEQISLHSWAVNFLENELIAFILFSICSEVSPWKGVLPSIMK